MQVFVTVDKLALMRVLQFMGLDVLPQSLDDDRSGLGVDAKHAGQSRVQLELRGLVCFGHSETALQRDRLLSGQESSRLMPKTYLVVQHEQDGAADAHVARPLHLEAVSFLGGGSSMPLNTKRKAVETF